MREGSLCGVWATQLIGLALPSLPFPTMASAGGGETFQPQLPRRGYGARLRALVPSSGYGRSPSTSRSAGGKGRKGEAGGRAA